MSDAIKRDIARYGDDGCEVAPHCLSCPLPRCKYDEPSSRVRNLTRREAMRADRAAGMTASEIAKRYGVSKTTVYKVTSQRLVEGEG